MSKEFMIVESYSRGEIESKLDEYTKAKWDFVAMSTAIDGGNRNNYTVLLSRSYVEPNAGQP